MKIERTETLHETCIPIKGREPFLSFYHPDLIVNVHSQFGQSHNLIDASYGGREIPLYKVGKGDILQIKLVRVSAREISWWKYVWEKVKGIFQ